MSYNCQKNKSSVFFSYGDKQHANKSHLKIYHCISSPKGCKIWLDKGVYYWHKFESGRAYLHLQTHTAIYTLWNYVASLSLIEFYHMPINSFSRLFPLFESVLPFARKNMCELWWEKFFLPLRNAKNLKRTWRENHGLGIIVLAKVQCGRKARREKKMRTHK